MKPTAESERPFAGARPRLATVLHHDDDLTITQLASAEMHARDRGLLVRIDAINAGQVYTVMGGQDFALGRHPDNTGCIDDQGISRHHAHIVFKNGRCVVRDLGSSNGTYVNGQPADDTELRNGDTLQLGPRVAFRFSIASAAEERVLRQLYESSVKDPLTQIFNRQYFDAQVTAELSFAVRHSAQLSLLLIDIDFFKKVNDTYGHLAGDSALKAVAAVLQAELRSEDILARYGGEEFVILLRGVGIEDAIRAAERLRTAVEQTCIPFAGQDIRVTLSVGCAAISCCSEPSPDVLLELADTRLYRAKRSGRNRVVGQ